MSDKQDTTTPEVKTSLKSGKLRRTLLFLVGLAVFMFGFSYAMVPFYDVLCKKLGINGKTNKTAAVYTGKEQVDKKRWVTVEFVTTRNAQLPWEFRPIVKKIRIHPGDINRVMFYAKNNSDKEMMVQAIPSVTPGLAASHLKKTECFCFTQQTLKAGESMDMPVMFLVDTDLPDNINEFTLSYTMFDITNMKRRGNADNQPGRIS